MAISFWNLLGQAALIDWLFGRKDKPSAVQAPQRPASYYIKQEERISALEDKILAAQSRIDELQDELDERFDEDSDEYLKKQGLIDDLQFDLDIMEDETEKIRDDFEDELDDY